MDKEQMLKMIHAEEGNPFQGILQYITDQVIDPIEIVEEIDVTPENASERVWMSPREAIHADPTTIDTAAIEEPRYLRYRIVFSRDTQQFFRDPVEFLGVMSYWAAYLDQRLLPEGLRWSSSKGDTYIIYIECQLDHYGS